ncbi:MAG: hypothetical protein JNK27_10290 [Chitinophagaceae bacterium]|nr:hypothetical protein [Chitinophagaceae bacterium]
MTVFPQGKTGFPNEERNSHLFLYRTVAKLCCQQQLLFINIHSHYPHATGEWTIQSLWTDFGKTVMPGQYSIDIHLWYIHASHWENQLELLREASPNPSILAMGNAG